MFARAVDSDETIKNSLKNVIFWNNNCEVGEGIDVAKKYNVRGYPTFIMTNGDGEVSSAWIGYPGPEKWADNVYAGDKDRRTLAEKKTAFEKHSTKELACSLANSAAANYDFAGSVKYFRSARELNPAGAQEYTSEILTNMYYGARSGAFTLDDMTAEADIVMAAKSSTAEDKLTVATLVRGMASQMGDLDAAIPYITAGLKASEGVEELAETRISLEIDYALLVEKDKSKALKLKRKSMTEGWEEDPNALNNFAWWCYENNFNLEEAKKLALHGVDIAAEDGQKSNILDTAAEICNAMDDCKEAVELMRLAVELSPDRDYYQTQLAKFEKVLQEKSDG